MTPAVNYIFVEKKLWHYKNSFKAHLHSPDGSQKDLLYCPHKQQKLQPFAQIRVACECFSWLNIAKDSWILTIAVDGIFKEKLWQCKNCFKSSFSLAIFLTRTSPKLLATLRHLP
jgi:hypothetical protein